MVICVGFNENIVVLINLYNSSIINIVIYIRVRVIIYWVNDLVVNY